jgi:predicted metalloendopeptidase
MNRLGSAADKKEWSMTPQTVILGGYSEWAVIAFRMESVT